MQLEKVRDWVAGARAIAVLTGAGISAESGIPAFRGAGGLWRNFRAEDLATPRAFARDPLLVWEWYAWRRELIARAEPNPGHLALAELERRNPAFHLVTQNVDGLHDRAGSQAILKIHGDLWDLRCTACGRLWTDRTVPLPELPPRCACGGLARPGVVWFGESLPPDAWGRAERAAAGCNLLLVVGTSAVVYPAAGLSPVARAGGARIVEVNIGETPMSGLADAVLRGPASEILPLICA